MKIVIFGNSGSGKSTLARQLKEVHQLEHLDLDTVAWLDTKPPQRAPLTLAGTKILSFIESFDSWVIEGCYTDLLEQAVGYATHMVYLNLPIELCIENARNRSFEPHKYASKELQDANLPMLIDWIRQYTDRTDTFSQGAHLGLFERFEGEKVMPVSNDRDSLW